MEDDESKDDGDLDQMNDLNPVLGRMLERIQIEAKGS